MMITKSSLEQWFGLFVRGFSWSRQTSVHAGVFISVCAGSSTRKEGSPG
jgi:hypothetical protein